MNAQAGAQAPPPAPPTVIVVNRDRPETPPYMKRGTEMYGMVMRSGCMSASLICSVLFFICGISLISLVFSHEEFYKPLLIVIAFFLLGGFLLHLYKSAKHKAKREFDALPADHPDRVKYGGILLPGSVAASYPTANVYRFPSNAQGLGVAGPLAAAASSALFSRPAGASAKEQYPPPYPPPEGQNPPPQGPSAPPQGSSAKYEDDPPPYSEI
ncbi:uncharacterized protein LOC122265294 [Penaeus japonicus]|uniref:uncharacterized protein LOC122265294 n=1 Tax=Penaeus japonicus TaxID=27405 RepID=UPI001C70BAFD|nr:uncharacterized protein LOC122265294 [Penaeus japonicus]